jgi:phospholipid transport system substrate-binding protein
MRAGSFLALLVFVVSFGTARAETDAPSARFINGLVSEAVVTLRDQALSDTDRNKKLQNLLAKNFDMPRIARYVLGRYWRDASDQDRAQFADLFQQWVVKTYAARLARYAGETVEVTGARDDGDGAVVMSRIIHPSGPPTNVSWRVAGHDGDFKIIDIGVEGVSLALTEREEIADTIAQQGGTVAAINGVLKKKLAAEATADAH